MEQYANALAKLIPLNSIEEFCKQFLQEYPDKQTMDVQELRTFLRNIIGMGPAAENNEAGVLTEDSLIADGYNVMALKHLRYLPGCFHSHDFFEINCVLSGSCTYRTVEKSVQIQEGTIVVFPPHAAHLIDIRTDDCILINILIRASTFDRYFFNLFQRHDVLTDFWTQALYGKREAAYLLFCCGDEMKIRKCVLDIFQEANRSSKYQSQMLDALLHVFLITLLQSHEHDLVLANPEHQRDDGNILPIMNYIAKEYRTLTLSKLAGEFHYSERQMMRVLKEYTSMNFGELIRDIKLKKAVALLEKSNVPLQSIAETAGYSDLSHFYRVFKKAYGCAPSEYRARKQ